MSLDYAILGFLDSQELSGYDLKTKCFDGAVAHFWTADQAQVYRTLDRLKSRGLVSATRRRQTARPDRRVYAITPTGRRALTEWLAGPHALPPYRNPFLIQVNFAEGLSNDALAEVLERQREQHQMRLADLRARSASAPGKGGGKRTPSRAELLHRMTFDAAMAQERSSIDWLDDCIEVLQRTPSSGSGGQRRPVGTRMSQGRSGS
ncbi:MAG: PadR family transcriptional regulator [Coriobacteriia bacterium]|nr:PadR family transcriptional regulator [Coriobacteriia bacterium]